MPRPVADYAAILADLDGTLVESSGPIARAWAAFASRHGLDPDWVIRAAQGRPSRETIAQLAPDDLEIESRRLEEAEVTDTDGVVALPGAAELLGAPLPLAIVTSCSRRLATVRLRAAGLPVPAVMVTADDVTNGKPDPECYLRGAQRMNSDPGECLALEDAPAGIAAARAAGMDVIALRTTHPETELSGASAIVDDLSALAVPAAGP